MGKNNTGYDFSFLDNISIQHTQDNTFNIFKQFRGFKEIDYSKIIASLLELTFDGEYKSLEVFLEQVAKDFAISTDDTITIETEKYTQEGSRRHDIFITCTSNHTQDDKAKWVISIENKINGASDSKNQVIDYLKDLESSYYGTEHYALIYLTPSGGKPSTDSISKDEYENNIIKKHIFLANQKTHLIKWLNNLMKNNWENLIADQRVYFFIKDFTRFLEGDTMDDENIAEIEQAMDEKRLETFFDIQGYYPTMLQARFAEINNKAREENKTWELHPWSNGTGEKHQWVVAFNLPYLQKLITGEEGKVEKESWKADFVLVLEYCVAGNFFRFGIRSDYLKEHTKREKLKKIMEGLKKFSNSDYHPTTKAVWYGSVEYLDYKIIENNEARADILTDIFSGKFVESGQLEKIEKLRYDIEELAKEQLNNTK